MRKQISFLILLLAVILCFGACSKPGKDSSFSIQFIDVGQGDSALVECDGHCMLIDGGNKSAGNIVYGVLEEKGIQHLDILAVSHLHLDHFGGLIKALTYVSDIDITISNSDDVNFDNVNSGNRKEKDFKDFEHQLRQSGSKITVPKMGNKYELGSAEVEVIDVSAEDENDSLVLLVTYGDTRFLFTGDIGETAQTRISEKYQDEPNSIFKIDLLKMPHHGANSDTLYRFLETFMADYVVISVGADNQYGHPEKEALEKLDNKTYKPKKIYRTDRNGDITVKSDGKHLTFETSQ